MANGHEKDIGTSPSCCAKQADSSHNLDDITTFLGSLDPKSRNLRNLAHWKSGVEVK